MKHGSVTAAYLPTNVSIIGYVTYLIANRHDNLVKGSQIFWVSHAGTVPRHIKGEALTSSPAHAIIVCILRGREEGSIVIAMDGDIQDTRLKADVHVRREGVACLLPMHTQLPNQMV